MKEDSKNYILKGLINQLEIIQNTVATLDKNFPEEAFNEDFDKLEALADSLFAKISDEAIANPESTDESSNEEATPEGT